MASTIYSSLKLNSKETKPPNKMETLPLPIVDCNYDVITILINRIQSYDKCKTYLDNNFILHKACKNGAIKIVKFLLTKNLEVNNYDDKTYMRPLEYLCNVLSANNVLEYFETFIKYGANVADIRLDQLTTLMYRLVKDSEQVMKKEEEESEIINGNQIIYNFIDLLIKNGFEMNSFCSNEGKNLLQFCTSIPQDNKTKVSLINVLLNMGVNINHQDNNGQTAIFYRNSIKLDVYKLLLNMGVNLNILDSKGNNVLNCICHYKYKDNTMFIKII